MIAKSYEVIVPPLELSTAKPTFLFFETLTRSVSPGGGEDPKSGYLSIARVFGLLLFLQNFLNSLKKMGSQRVEIAKHVKAACSMI